MNLWPGQAPGAKRPPVGTETGGSNWRFSNTEVPQYSLFPAEEPNGTGVVILPGGGYANLAADHEGRQVAQWFATRGITAMVVKYRVSANPDLGYHFPVPQLDARRAIRIMRFKAREWGLDPRRVGILGFSAGDIYVQPQSRCLRISSRRKPMTALIRSVAALILAFSVIRS